jgi:hypothetical protein
MRDSGSMFRYLRDGGTGCAATAAGLDTEAQELAFPRESLKVIPVVTPSDPCHIARYPGGSRLSFMLRRQACCHI